MTVFVLACALMLLLALMWVCAPLLKAWRVNRTATTERGQWSIMLLVSAVVLVLSVGMYVRYSNWSWSAAADVAQGSAANSADHSNAALLAEIKAYQARVSADASDREGWLLLGKAQVAAEQFAEASKSYQQAYDLSQGQDVEAITGLAEALVLADQTSMNGRAAILVEEALKLDPKQPKALWYGGLIALQLENWPLAKQRFQAMLQLDPPDTVKTILERQIAALDAQINGGAVAGNAGGAPVASTATSKRSIRVSVTLPDKLKQQIKQPMTLFILARNPAQPGAPYAVQRHDMQELPLQTELTVADAMLPGRTLAELDEVDVVARLSASGTPTESSGDYYGSVHYSFATQGDSGKLSIEINQRVP